MGSKTGMLSGVLGEKLDALAPVGGRFIDLFSGSGAVAQYVATRKSVPVVGVDLMRFSGALNAATIERTRVVDAEGLFAQWDERANELRTGHAELVYDATNLSVPVSAAMVMEGRALCKVPVEDGFIWSHYGGYYFSPVQALELSFFYKTLPSRNPLRSVALAALLRTASRASASPGHTAQPFRPTETLLPHLRSAWRTDIGFELKRQVLKVAPAVALRRGVTVTGDSVTYASRRIRDGDLVFCDPPYSEAQYSRFYHVLEGIAVGGWDSVSGAGRAPASSQRPSSDFSRRSRAVSATENLIEALSRKRTTVLWTYPEGDRSNGLTVEHIRASAETRFRVSETRIPMRHSTLGGSVNNHDQRQGRRDLYEVLFRFDPK